jgi:serine-type D-Ala-D-Ala carboxypeptidase/endopeptidase
MAEIVAPRRDQLESLVEPYLQTQRSGLGFAIGFAGPTLAEYGGIECFGDVRNQFGKELTLGNDTPFEIASISKTFTATLYASLIRASHPDGVLGDFIDPKGPLRISDTLAAIKLDGLVNYTSGLPNDNLDQPVAVPPFQAQPYAMPGMLSYLHEAPPSLSWPNESFTYSNLAFAIMSAIIAAEDKTNIPVIHTFVRKMQEHIFKPLGLGAKFFNGASLADLPLGFGYDYWPPDYDSPGFWPKPPGHPLYPAYFGAHGVVATPDDMRKWLLFNMGIVRDDRLTPLLPLLQTPSTPITTDDPAGSNDWYRLGLGWFISPERGELPAMVSKDGELDGFASNIAFIQSPDPGKVPSPAGAFVLVNASRITDTQTKDGRDVAYVLTNDVLALMQGRKPPPDKSVYPPSPRAVVSRG